MPSIDISDVITLTGQVRRRRKLSKYLFFIDIQPTDPTVPKSQIFFRTDDGSLDEFSFLDTFRACRPGSVIQVQVGELNDPSEQQSHNYKVWQSNKPVVVIEPYTSRDPFLQDPPLGSALVNKDMEVTKEVELRSGEKVLKSELVCKYWINKNVCERGHDCLFQHPIGEAFDEAQVKWVEERTKSRKEANYNPNDPHTSKKPHGVRAIIFADWIRKTFEKQLVNGELLDIAGGKGEISYVLSKGFGIKTTVVEPNKRKLPNYWFTRLRRLMYKFEHGHLQRDDEPDWKDEKVQEELVKWPCDETPHYMHTLLNDQFLADHQELVARTSVFIGLHSDQATIPIVEAALKARKAFAVVPCCVFSHDNRSRRLRSGELVTTTEQQIQYICEKDPHIKTAYLNFEGKNMVVYWNPDKIN